MTKADERPKKPARTGTHAGHVAQTPVAPQPSGEVLYRALLEAALDPTIAIDSFGTVVAASASVERAFGWTVDELRGKNVRVLMPEPHSGQHDDYLANYRRTGVANILNRTREFEVLRKDGSRLICELSVARAEMVDGSPPLFIGAFRDITRRHEAERAREESERRFHAIFDRSYQFMGLLQPDGTLLEANQTALDAVGTTREEVVGRPFWETPWWNVSEDERARVKAAIAEAAGGKFVRYETVHRNKDGDLLTVDFSLNPVRDATGKVVMLIPEGRNITDLKRAQRAETAMLRALATIGESAAMLAHEIKNPITAVNVALRAVAKQLGEDDAAVLEDLVARMQKLEALMRRTLSFTKPIELRITRLESRELLEQAVRALRPEIVKRGAEVALEPGTEALRFQGDRQLLDEVLTNLIKNALEASTERMHIVLSARRQSGGGVVLVVEDDGPGIPESLKTTLFKPFTTTKRSGTGLGLAFCKKVVEEHGGTIEVLKSALGGARFEVRLPAVT